jgi:hypothetical protein
LDFDDRPIFSHRPDDSGPQAIVGLFHFWKSHAAFARTTKNTDVAFNATEAGPP